MSQQSVFQDNKHHVSLELMKGEVADAVLEAIRERNDGVKVSDLPGYIIIEVPDRLEVDAELVREHLGKSEWAMTDLNEIMAAFSGHFETYNEHDLVLSRLKI
jgi:hypothetical protein